MLATRRTRRCLINRQPYLAWSQYRWNSAYSILVIVYSSLGLMRCVFEKSRSSLRKADIVVRPLAIPALCNFHGLFQRLFASYSQVLCTKFASTSSVIIYRVAFITDMTKVSMRDTSFIPISREWEDYGDPWGSFPRNITHGSPNGGEPGWVHVIRLK